MATTKKNPFVRVMVEMRQDTAGIEAVDSLSMAQELSPTFQLDSEFDPIPMASPSGPEALMAHEHESIIVVRGTIPVDDIESLEAQPNVVKVWRDAPIVPFTSQEEPIQAIASVGDTLDCPISPCGCQMTAVGDLASVRKFLGVDQVWDDGYRGQGIVIGMVDTLTSRASKPSPT